MPRGKSNRILTIVVLNFILAGFMAIASVLRLGSRVLLAASKPGGPDVNELIAREVPNYPLVSVLSSGVALLTAIGLFAASAGLMRGREWGRRLASLCSALVVGLCIVDCYLLYYQLKVLPKLLVQGARPDRLDFAAGVTAGLYFMIAVQVIYAGYFLVELLILTLRGSKDSEEYEDDHDDEEDAHEEEDRRRRRRSDSHRDDRRDRDDRPARERRRDEDDDRPRRRRED